MKKRIAEIITLLLFAGIISTMPAYAAETEKEDAPPLPPQIKKDVDVTAVFAKAQAQPIQGPAAEAEDSVQIKADTIWIYYSDNTFDQFTETPAGYVLFSTGTYSFTEGGDFVIVEGEDNGSIAIDRNQKYSMETRKPEEYASSHEYDLGTLGFVQLYGPESGKEVEAIFGDTYQIRHADQDGVVRHLDGVWIYYTDGSFCEYAFLDGDVTLYSNGTYEFDESGDFHILPYEEDYGTITVTWEDSLGELKGQSETYDLGSTGFVCFYEKQDPDLELPERPTEEN